METGFLARWLPSMPATFRAVFFLRTFTLEKEMRIFFFSSARWNLEPEKTKYRGQRQNYSVD